MSTITILNPPQFAVTVTNTGIRLVQIGIPGPPGAGGVSYVHTQAVASAIWTVNHNLGFRPTVELYDAGGAEIDAEVIHVSTNQANIYLTAAITGAARCI